MSDVVESGKDANMSDDLWELYISQHVVNIEIRKLLFFIKKKPHDHLISIDLIVRISN